MGIKVWHSKITSSYIMITRVWQHFWWDLNFRTPVPKEWSIESLERLESRHTGVHPAFINSVVFELQNHCHAKERERGEDQTPIFSKTMAQHGSTSWHSWTEQTMARANYQPLRGWHKEMSWKWNPNFTQYGSKFTLGRMCWPKVRPGITHHGHGKGKPWSWS